MIYLLILIIFQFPPTKPPNQSLPSICVNCSQIHYNFIHSITNTTSAYLLALTYVKRIVRPTYIIRTNIIHTHARRAETPTDLMPLKFSILCAQIVKEETWVICVKCRWCVREMPKVKYMRKQNGPVIIIFTTWKLS